MAKATINPKLAAELAIANRILFNEGVVDGFGHVSLRDPDNPARAEAVARLVAGHAPLTLKATKEALRRLMPRIPPGEGNDLILMCYMSKDFREGMTAFLEKRPPKFTGE